VKFISINESSIIFKGQTRSERQYDLIPDVVVHRSVFAYERALKPNGTYFFVGGSIAVIFQSLLFRPLIRKASGKNMHILIVPQNRKNLVSMTELCENGGIIPIIDKQYTLSDVPEAFRYVVEGRAKGKVVITVD
jgi:NADPH:quinone reductase-like Zn-dependent oxidoreductase